MAFRQGVVTIPPGAITDSLGKPFLGSALVHVTPIDVQDREYRPVCAGY